jgi:hypothetical protein
MLKEAVSPAEQIVEAAAPQSMQEELSEFDVDSTGEAIRPWEPKGEEALGAPPAVTVEGDRLEFSPGPPQEVAGGSPSALNSFARWSKDE